MDLQKEHDKILQRKKPYRTTPKDYCEVTIFDFSKGIKKKYNGTYYFYYECLIHILNKKPMPYGRYILQVPMATAWLQLYNVLNKNHLLNDKNLFIKLTKVNNYSYDIAIEIDSSLID